MKKQQSTSSASKKKIFSIQEKLQEFIEVKPAFSEVFLKELEFCINLKGTNRACFFSAYNDYNCEIKLALLKSQYLFVSKNKDKAFLEAVIFTCRLIEINYQSALKSQILVKALGSMSSLSFKRFTSQVNFYKEVLGNIASCLDSLVQSEKRSQKNAQ